MLRLFRRSPEYRVVHKTRQVRKRGSPTIFHGYPLHTMVLELMKKFGCDKKDVVVVGDRLYTDIASGVNAGVDTVCVLCGEVTLDDTEHIYPFSEETN